MSERVAALARVAASNRQDAPRSEWYQALPPMIPDPEQAEAWAKRFGTPYFVYNLDTIQRQIARLDAALPAGLWVAYAVKANPHPHVVAAMRAASLRADVSSAGELGLVKNAGFSGPTICVSGPAKSAHLLACAAALDAVVTVESTAQLALLAATTPGGAAVVRVSPREPIHAYRASMSGAAPPFGVPEDALGDFLAAARRHRVPIRGLQVFAGSECSSAAAVLRSVVQTLDLAEALRRDGAAIEWISFGGGFAVDLDVDALGRKLAPALDTFVRATGDHPAWGFELGRFLVADAGVYVTRVVSRQDATSPARVYLDGGFHHVMFATGRFGGAPAPLVNLSRPDAEETTAWVSGPLCTPLDRFGDAPCVVPEPRVGDLVGVVRCGAYGLSASPAGFISHRRPAELIWVDGALRSR